MPIAVAIVNGEDAKEAIDKVFDYFKYVDEKFSTYKETSEISRINRGEISESAFSIDMKTVFELSKKTSEETNGFFDIHTPGKAIDPSGLVKGRSIYNAVKILDEREFKNFFVDAGGDVETRGVNEKDEKWTIGIRNPFKLGEIVKTVAVSGMGVATSGTYIRGQHIYNPFEAGPLTEIVSITVIGPNIYEADRFATAAFAMGRNGVSFIEKRPGLEAYQIDKNGIATMTSGFSKYVAA